MSQTIPANSRPGVTNGMAKLTDALVRDIRARHAALPRWGNGRLHWGAFKALAVEMNLPYGTVRNVMDERRWGHVKEKT